MSCHLCLKLQILIEAIRSNCGGEWARGRRWFLYFVLIRLRYSCSTPLLPRFFQFYLFISGWGLSGSSVLGSSIGGLVAPSAGTAFSLSSPSVLPTSVTISCLVHSSLCVFACKGRTVCLVGLSSNAIISTFTVITTWGSVQVVKSTGFASSSWGVSSCLLC